MVEVKHKRPRRRQLTLAQAKQRKKEGREWKAAKSSLTVAGWLQQSRPIDWDLRYQLEALRARSRAEAQNNDHLKHFLRLVKTNIIGPQGIRMQGRVKKRNGKPDDRANQAAEESWARWGKHGSPDVTGTKSWRGIQRDFVETLARDGESLYRKIRGWPNGFGFALQEMDPTLLDVQYNETLKSGNVVVMGVELDPWRRPVAYHFIEDKRPVYSTSRERQRKRIPASEIYHCFLPEWTLQTRGVPWMASALLRAHQLNGYTDAHVTGARVAAAKMGFYTQEGSATPYVGTDEDEKGNPIQDARPGEFEILPEGYNFTAFDPGYPNSGYGEFVRDMLRGIASGLGVNYNTLANDLQGVNYTSLRHGMLNERDVWMMLQDYVVECFCDKVYADWLEEAAINDAIVQGGRPIPANRIDSLRSVAWQPRRWPWVDPEKEAKAQRQQFELRTRSISDIIRERGDDPDEVWEEMRRDNERMKELGISPPTEGKNTPPANGNDEDSGDESTEQDDAA